MPFDPSDTRRTAEFDAFRREMVLHSVTVSGPAREQWFEKLKTLVEGMFPGAQTHFRKPGLATRMFSVEVELPEQDKYHLLDLCQELDDNWRAMVKSEVKAGASCVYRDRLDGIWEWAADLGPCYVTGHVKLRNFKFERPTDRPRPMRDNRGDRPDRPNRDSRPGSRGGYGKPSSSGPYRPSGKFGGPPRRKGPDDRRRP
ncbi:MAG: hypothetical protein JNM34_09100 [Chthonomonadaceae bacterium]|nr:hypothetical protein [Chthonomonadaceae bacterium]